MAIPQVANHEAISTLTTGDPMSHRTGTSGPQALAFPASRKWKRGSAEVGAGQISSAALELENSPGYNLSG